MTLILPGPPVVPDLAHADELRWRASGLSLLRSALHSTRLDTAFRNARLAVRQVKTVVARLVIDGRKEFRAVTGLLVQRTLSLPTWIASMRDGIASRHFAAGWLALRTTTPDPVDSGILRGFVARQLGYLDRFADAIRTGAHLLGGRTEARAAMYADAAWQTAANTELASQQRHGTGEARRILGAAERHCVDCPGLADLGWVPIDEMVPIGDTQCGGRCKCSIEYR